MSLAGQESTVEAEINYAAEPPRSDPSRGIEYYMTRVDRNNMELEPRSVSFTDARPLVGRLDLDREGFVLAAHESAVTDYRDETQRPGQMRELEALIVEMTGASAAYCLGVGLPRFGETDKAGYERFNAGRQRLLHDARPARFIHADFTDASAEALFQRWPGLDRDRYSRFAVFNVWRAISPPPQDIPLAVCDARTIDPAGELDALAVLDDPSGDQFTNMTAIYKPDARHRWYYFSDMTRDEVLIFKSHDSDPTRAHRVPHTAFTDPKCPPGTPTRSSVEHRVFAVFE